MAKKEKRGESPRETGAAQTLTREARGAETAGRGGGGREFEATLAAPGRSDPINTSEPRLVDPDPAPLSAGDPARRYELRRQLGEGGMGVVRLYRDTWLGREVAMKVAHSGAHADAERRFLREARVQGQLEHPSIVPVYDIGVMPDRSTFFTMKRVRGHTLADVVEHLSSAGATAKKHYTQHRLLSALSNVCVAVAFAHSRGVVHRDLKPENIMLGDFGEVYVLDWGVAKIGANEDADEPGSIVTSTGSHTQNGAILGTPGYAAPEQISGDTRRVEQKSDIYSLGVILFEVLTLERLHVGANLQELLTSTLTTDGARPAQRGVEIAPELDAICARATALEPEDRFSTARELHEALESYLAGERDSELRHEMARRHVAEAKEALSFVANSGADAEEHRRRAMRSLGAAIALEPDNDSAIETLSAVLLEAPDHLPPEAEAELAEVNRRDRVRGARAAAAGYASMLLALPIVLAMGVRSWPAVFALDAVTSLLIGYTVWIWRTGNAVPKYMSKAIVLNFVLVAMLGVFFGPLVLVPGAAAVTGAAFMVSIRANRVTRRGIFAMSLAAVFLPLSLQLSGVLPPSYAVEDGVLKILPQIVHFPPTFTIALLAVASALIVGSAPLMVGRAVEALIEAERRNFTQAWRLRVLLPGDAPAAVSQK